MIYKKGCYYCDEVKPIIKEFEKKNKSNIDVIYINILSDEYSENKYGKVETVPHFIFENQGKKKHFDFFDDLHQKRTYNKLVNVLNQFVSN
jgi:thiol-disulfide isomerase/thioredoxin